MHVGISNKGSTPYSPAFFIKGNMETKIFGQLESEDCLTQIQMCAEKAELSALMADHHLGYSMPIGGVVAYDGYISPSGVGFDIACGNKAILIDTELSYVEKNIERIMDEVVSRISFGVGRNNNTPIEVPILEKNGHPAWDIPEIMALKRKASNQLGTVGSGNHYVDIFKDELNRVWVGCHFGSRGLGHTIATRYLKLGGGKDSMMAEPTLIGADTDLGLEYLMAMDLAGQYAYAGRDYVCSKVAEILGGEILDEVHNHHNYAWEEVHNDKKLWVVRKGATPCFPHQRGFVGGSMGDNSVILKGKDTPENKDAIYSTVHGAGRIMSRTKATGKKRWIKNDKTGKKEQVQISEGCVSIDMMRDWINPLGVVLRGGGTDESPHCYKRLPEVLSYHSECVEIEHILSPLGVAMAGANEFDPYKD